MKILFAGRNFSIEGHCDTCSSRLLICETDWVDNKCKCPVCGAELNKGTFKREPYQTLTQNYRGNRHYGNKPYNGPRGTCSRVKVYDETVDEKADNAVKEVVEANTVVPND